jgi:hypothetical protein
MIRKAEWKYIHFSYYNKNLLFNLRDDPGEMHDLAGAAETASIERELHDTLTSMVDPGAVTTRAFERQEQVLAGVIRDNNPDDFRRILESRLGQGQAAVLTQKHYPNWHPAA